MDRQSRLSQRIANDITYAKFITDSAAGSVTRTVRNVTVQSRSWPTREGHPVEGTETRLPASYASWLASNQRATERKGKKSTVGNSSGNFQQSHAAGTASGSIAAVVHAIIARCWKPNAVTKSLSS